MSSFTKLSNAIKEYEINSTRIITPENYFIVKIVPVYLPDKLATPQASLLRNQEFAKLYASGLLSVGANTNVSNTNVLCTYANAMCTLLLFGALEKGEHLLGGDQQKIISYITSKAVLFYGVECTVTIVELKSRMKVISYFHNTSFSCSSYVGNTPQEKYGIFYKYVTDGNKNKYVTLSEEINMKEIEKYKSYIFE